LPKIARRRFRRRPLRGQQTDETTKASLHGFIPFPHDIRITFAKTGPQQSFVFGLRGAKRHSSGFPPRSGRLKQFSTKEKSGYPAVPLPLKRISGGGWGIDLSRRPGGFLEFPLSERSVSAQTGVLGIQPAPVSAKWLNGSNSLGCVYFGTFRHVRKMMQ
jgi:hypothetical protein